MRKYNFKKAKYFNRRSYMKKYLLAVSGLFLISSFSQSFASSSELVCVSADELFEQSTYAQTLKKQMENKRKEIFQEFSKKAQEIKKKLEKIQQELNSGLLSEEAKKEKQKEYINLQMELQQLQYQLSQELQEYAQKVLKKLDNMTRMAVKALQKTLGFKAVADCNAFFYYDKSIDISPMVAKILDQMAKENKSNQ